MSSGLDSSAAYDFLSRNHTVIPIFFNHGTEESKKAQDFLHNFFFHLAAKPNGRVFKSLQIGIIKNPAKPKDKSWEEYWREERYKFFEEVIEKNTKYCPGPDCTGECKEDQPFFITAHHLDDAAEGYLFGALNGTPKLIKYDNGIVKRPFLLNTKKDLLDWCRTHKVPFLEAESNQNTKFKRNYIRKEIMPRALEVNPGFLKVIKKKILEKLAHDGDFHDKEVAYKQLKGL